MSVKSSGVDVSGSPKPGASAPGTLYLLSAGNYVVSENTNTSYAKSFSGICDSSGNSTLIAGDDKTCTITNTYIVPPPVVSSGGSSSGSTIYGCKDPAASNYQYFVASNPALCVYGTVSTTTPVVTATTTALITPISVSASIPSFPDTGFAPENGPETNVWIRILMFLFLILISQHLLMSLPKISFLIVLTSVLFFKEQVFSNKNVDSRSVPQTISGTGSASQFRIIIPAIGINSAVELVGLTSSGAVDVPKGPNNAAWFDLGPRPGSVGDAVIVGHYGWKGGIPAVFDNLSKLQKGDNIYIYNDVTTTTIFVVRETRIFGEDDSAVSVFNSSDGKSHLNLITCGGIWNATNHSYSDRLVVFADLVTK